MMRSKAISASLVNVEELAALAEAAALAPGVLRVALLRRAPQQSR